MDLVFSWRRPNKGKARLEVTDAGLALFEKGVEVFRFVWGDVVRVETWKDDAWSVDLVCLGFCLRGAVQGWQVDDEMEGFGELTDRLVAFFPEVPAGWWLEVAFPAFERNHRVLFERGGE